MIFKIYSRFPKGDPKYEPPFYVNVCEGKGSKESQLSKNVAKIKKIDPYTVRVSSGKFFGYWGLVELIYNDRWTRWYSVEKVSNSKEPTTKLGGGWREKPSVTSNGWPMDASLDSFTITYNRI